MVEAPVLEVRKLGLHYGKQRVVHEVSFGLYPGRVLALIGPNGSGKSSIMRMIAGLVPPGKGSVWLYGSTVPSRTAVHGAAGFFIESPDFYKNLNAIQNLELLRRVRGADQSSMDLLRMVGIDYAAFKKVRKFSRGMKQRLGIAQALLGDPDILVLDEPFNGLDPEVKQFLMEMLLELARKKGKAILVSSHLLSDMEVLADDFVLMKEGEVRLAGSLSDYHSRPQTVRFWFEREPDGEVLGRTSAGKMVGTEPWCWETRLTPSETTSALGTWTSAGCIPYEIQRADLLQTTYKEIIG